MALQKLTEEQKLKGAQVSAQKRRDHKKMKDDLKTLLRLSLRRGDLLDVDEALDLAQLQGKNISVQTAMDLAMVQRAIMGDVQAYTIIRDTIGEKPTDKVELDSSLTIETWVKNHKVKL